MQISEIKQTSSELFTLVMSDSSEIKTSLSVISDLNLYSGRELDDEDIREIRMASSYSFCKTRALRIIGQQTLSKKELYTKLVNKGEDEANAEKICDWLEEVHLLDDSRYAGIVVRHYAAKGYGASRIRNELYRHGVPKQYWDEAFEQMPDQDDKIDKFIQTRLKDPSDKDQVRKISQSLARRGYSWTEIKNALERFQADDEDYYE